MGQVVHLEPPVAGLNARDAVDGLQPNEAIRLVNWVPDLGYMRSRRGHVFIADVGTGAPVETLMSFEAAGAEQLLACSNFRLFDITDPDAIIEIGIPAGLTASRLQYATFTDLNGDQRLIVTGSDEITDNIIPFVYNPADNTAVSLNATGPASLETLFEPTIFKGSSRWAARSRGVD
jgi:hypothetical protein